MSIGENIKKLRKNIGLSQVQLAEKLDTTQKVITDYETGRSKPPRKRLPKIANFFGITIEDLIGEENLEQKQSRHQKQQHGNKRSVKVLKLFEKLANEEQRVILKQIKALAEK